MDLETTTETNPANDETTGSTGETFDASGEADGVADETPALRGATAAYDPADDKLRLRALARLPEDIYARVKAAGFGWAPKQECFYAIWSPAREDLIEALAGEIGDEDTSLVERAEERAGRFEGYSERRAADAAGAQASADAVSERFAFGQPILVGHHSERRARKDKERMESGLRRAIRMWETSEYWTRRAAGAVRAAKYKELPAVRHRRIKKLESDHRRYERLLKDAETFTAAWQKEGLTRAGAIAIANFDHVRLVPTEATRSWGGASLWDALSRDDLAVEAAVARAVEVHARQIAFGKRWLAHLDNRLAYERAMLGESGGIQADKFEIQVGGRVFVRREWHVVKSVNRVEGRINSVSVVGGYYTRAIEEVTDYRPPQAGDAEKVKAKTKLPPLANYPGEGFLHLTKAEWDRRPSDCGRTSVREATATWGQHRVRERFVGGGSWKMVSVFLTDQKRIDPPAPPAPDAASPEPVAFAPVLDGPVLPSRRAQKPVEQHPLDALKARLKEGVKVVHLNAALDQFWTPDELAADLVMRAMREGGYTSLAGLDVLEPSAGGGALVRAALAAGAPRVTAIDVDPSMIAFLECVPGVKPICADFLGLTPATLGGGETERRFDLIPMNPPFNGQKDIDHVTHAWPFLRRGGVLVAVMSAGVEFRQDRKATDFRARVAAVGGTIERLTEGSFEVSGTKVNTVLVTMVKP